MGSRAFGVECQDINECVEQFPTPCLNGGKCRNFEDERMFMCHCPRNYSGMICDLEVLPAGILTTSTDFIIALVVCILVLLSKFCRHAPVHYVGHLFIFYRSLLIWENGFSFFHKKFMCMSPPFNPLPYNRT